jgi:pyruvate kinase
MRKKTKIVATISDMNCSVEFIKALYDRGMNVARVNTAHQTPEDTLLVVNNVREVSDTIPIIVDTKGPEMRTSSLKVPFMVRTGQTIKMKGNPTEPSTPECIHVSYPNFVEDVPVGSSVLIDDGSLKFTVLSKDDEFLYMRVENDGLIESRKSINVPNVHVNLPPLSPKDLAYIDFAIENDIEFLAHSFVRNKEDIQAIQQMLDKANSKVKIIAKIENQEGVDNIDEILDCAYGVMIARGDLGIEIDAEKIPVIQRLLINKCIQRKKPVITATQLLHTMIKNPRPTRAEVNDVATAVYLGSDALMLSGETTFGAYPLEAVETLRKIAEEVEPHVEGKFPAPSVTDDNRVHVFLANAAVEASKDLPIKAVFLDTMTGRTARYISAFRGQRLVYSVCYNKRVMRELALSYGVYPAYYESRQSPDEFRNDALAMLLKEKGFASEDMIVLVGGNYDPKIGATFLEVNTINNFMLMFKGESI